MELGHLQIPRVGIERFAFIRDFQTRLLVQYTDLAGKTDLGRQLVANLREDPRVVRLEGKMISHGCGAEAFQVESLAAWFLWYANEHGLEVAQKQLDAFLDADRMPVLSALWVLGLEVEEPLELGCGLAIQPAGSMPDSADKERFLRFDTGRGLRHTPTPSAALTRRCEVEKVVSGVPGEWVNRDPEFWATGGRLYEVAFVLNALEGVSCLPYYATSYALPSTPVGPFGGSGGSSPIYDVLGHGTSKLSGSSKAAIDSLIASYDSLPASEKARMHLILSRLSLAKRRLQIEDKILDLAVALEMLLLHNSNSNNQQLGLTFRLRGSWLVAASAEERLLMYGQLRDLYELRCQVAHNGVLCRGDTKEIAKVRESFPAYQSLAERICRKILDQGNPDWHRLILNVAD